MERLPAVLGVAFSPELETRFDQLGVRSLSQRIVYHRFVLVYGDGTGRIHDVPARFRIGADAVDRAENELLLQMRQQSKIAFRLRD